MTMIGRMIATIRKWFGREPEHFPTEWFANGARCELLPDGSHHIVYNTGDEIWKRDDIVVAYKTHDGLTWKEMSHV